MNFPHYPVFLSLEDAGCLVIGGGAVGERKVRTLLCHGARVMLIAQHLTPWLEEACLKGEVLFLGSQYQSSFLENMDLVFVATSDLELNRRVAADARRMKVWCNMASAPREGSFIVPSLVNRGALSIAISTGGASPAIAKRIREQLETQFGPEWAHLLRFMELFREKVQGKGFQTALNQSLFTKVSRLPLLKWIKDRQGGKAIQEIFHICTPWLTAGEIESVWNETWNPSSS